MTVLELKKKIDKLPDDMPVMIHERHEREHYTLYVDVAQARVLPEPADSCRVGYGLYGKNIGTRCFCLHEDKEQA